jgi:hypothetical protein
LELGRKDIKRVKTSMLHHK